MRDRRADQGSSRCSLEPPDREPRRDGGDMRCPKDGSACPDDMCHGAGCLQMGGYSMLAQCDVCGGLIDEEIPDCSTCTCDDGDDYNYDEEAP